MSLCWGCGKMATEGGSLMGESLARLRGPLDVAPTVRAIAQLATESAGWPPSLKGFRHEAKLSDLCAGPLAEPPANLAVALTQGQSWAPLAIDDNEQSLWRAA